MLTQPQHDAIIQLVVDQYKNQFNVDLSQDTFHIHIEKGNTDALFSLELTTERTDDKFRCKLYATITGLYNIISDFNLTHEQNYSHGGSDLLQVATCTLSEKLFQSLHNYVDSASFTTDVLQAAARIVFEDGTGFLLQEANDNFVIQEEEGVTA